MTGCFLDLPPRPAKPRQSGLTLALDPGLSTQRFVDAVHSHAPLVDFVKFGWGTALVTSDLPEKVECLRAAGIDFFFGGTLFEKALQQRRLDEFHTYLKECGCRHVEISNGTLDIANDEKCRHIKDFSGEFTVFSEVGYKDNTKSENMFPARWVECIEQDFAAGATKVITEARESGRSGICRPNGELRYGLIEELIDSVERLDDVIFEAPVKLLQAFFVKRLGPAVSLGNIAFDDVVALETLRLGLRSDTFFLNGADR